MAGYRKRLTGLEFGSGNLISKAKEGENSVDDHQQTSTLRQPNVTSRRQPVDKPAIASSSREGSTPTLGDNFSSAASSKASDLLTRSLYKRDL